MNDYLNDRVCRTRSTAVLLPTLGRAFSRLSLQTSQTFNTHCQTSSSPTVPELKTSCPVSHTLGHTAEYGGRRAARLAQRCRRPAGHPARAAGRPAPRARGARHAAPPRPIPHGRTLPPCPNIHSHGLRPPPPPRPPHQTQEYARARVLAFNRQPALAAALRLDPGALPAATARLLGALLPPPEEPAPAAGAAAGAAAAARQLGLSFSHDCQHLGCADLHCALCQHVR